MRNLKLVLILCLALIGKNAIAQIPTAGLIGYYPFNGNANDASVIANNGTPVNGTALTTDRFGNANSAYNFDGADDYISIPHNVAYNFSDYTISLWFRYNAPGTAGTSIWSLISKNNSNSGYNDAFHIWISSGSFTVGGRMGTGGSEVYGGNPPTINNGQWHNATVVFNNNTDQMLYYVDGVLISTSPFPGANIFNPSEIRLGVWAGYGNYFNGKIDDVRIYNVGFTPAQVSILASECALSSVTQYQDADNDGYGNPAISQVNNCLLPGYSLNNTDCNDGNSAIHPGATDIVGNGIDEDCSGSDAQNLALDFDGTNDALTCGSVLTSAPAAFTVEWWLMPVSHINYNQNFGSVTGWGAFGFHTEVAGGVYCGTDLNNRFTPSELGANTLQLNVWQHFAFTYTGGVGKFYKNGILLATKSMNAPVGWNGFIATIHGSLDEVRIWNIARTQTQIQNNMNCQLSGTESGLVANYNFNNSSAIAAGNNGGLTTAIDNSPNGNNAALTNFALSGTTSNWVSGNTGFITTTYYADVDNDGYGNPLVSTTGGCTPPLGYVANNTDCNDANAAIKPGATEICNGIDDNCDGLIDEGFPQTTYFADTDGDGFGNPATTITQNTCIAPPANYVTNNTDCNDANAAINPAATEIIDGIDNDCNGLIDECITSPSLVWQKCLGGTATDFSQAIQPTADGGYISASMTSSNNGNVTGFHGGTFDWWIVKTDATGNIQWQKAIGGTGNEQNYNIQQTTDGGYIISGITNSNDGNVSGNHGGSYDAWVVKLDGAGNIVWQKCLGGSNDDQLFAIHQTNDGGYIAVGTTNSNNGDITTATHGASYDTWLVKLNSAGTIVFQKVLGGTSTDEGYNVKQTSDGGYIIESFSYSNDGDCAGSGYHGDMDIWVTKTDAIGTIQWQKSFGGTGTDFSYEIIQTADGGYMFVGNTSSNNGDVSGNHGGPNDGWVVKLNSAGALSWQKCFGGTGSDYISSVRQMPNGNYLFGGGTGSNNGDVSGNHGGSDVWALLVVPNSSIIWQKTFGGSGDEGMGYAGSLQQTINGNYFLGGTTTTLGTNGDVSGNHGGYDAWVVKFTTIAAASTSTTTASVCSDALPYVWNGNNYLTSGNHVVHFTNAVGCDSAATLALTVNQTSSSITTASVCNDALPYVWNGNNYSNTGSYIVHLTNAAGCDSTATLNLTVNQTSIAAVSATSTADFNEVCIGNSTNLMLNGGSLGTNATWKWYTGSCGGILAGSGSTITVSPTANTTYFARAEGTCNSSPCVQINVSVKTSAVSSLPIMPFSGMPPHVCNGTTATLSIAPVNKAGYYVWDAPSGSYFNGNPLNTSPYTTATPNVTVTFGNPSGSLYAIGVQAGNACGSSVRQSQKVRGITSVPASVIGPLTACANTVVNYSVSAVTGASSYLWTVTGNATVSGTGTTATVNFGAGWTGGTLCVAAQTTCYTSPTKCITISTSASTLNAISGAFTACPNSTVTYSVPACSGAASYSWVLPPGATGSSTTNSINTAFGPGYNAVGNICVSVTSICGVTSAIKCKTVAPGLPVVPASINGPANGLCNQSVVFTCPSQGSGITYTWTVPAGASIVSGQGTTSVNVAFGTFTTGSVCVKANNTCGSSTIRCITVKGYPATPGAITATPSGWCANQEGIEFNANVSGLSGSYTLSWSYPAHPVAAYILGGGNSANLLMDWGTGTGNINIVAYNACGSGTRSSTWSNTCREGEVTTVNTLSVAPNPTTGIMNIYYTATKGSTVITVLDLTGRIVMIQNAGSVDGVNNTPLDLSKLAKGAYMLNVKSTQGNKQIKVVLE